jgi:hypothetical protein
MRVHGRSLARAVVATAAAVVLAGCGGGPATRVPKLVGERLDVAQARLDNAGLEYETLGGGAFGVIVPSHWYVCAQRPGAGTRARKVELIVDRACDGGEEEDEDW